MVRGGRSGYRVYKRNLVYPLTQERARIVQLENPTAAETAALHTIEYILNRLDTVDCYQFSTASELAAALGRVWPPEPPQPPRPPSPPATRRPTTRDRTRSPSLPEFPDFPGNPHRVFVRSDPPRESTAPSSSSSRRVTATVQTVTSGAGRTTTIAPDVRDLRVAVLLDHHGVLDKSIRLSTELIRRLREEFGSQVYICCLSYAPSDHRIAEVTSHSQRLGVDVECTRIKFGERGKKGWARWILEREGISFAFFVDDQQALVDEVGSLGSHVEACVLPQWASILTVHSRIRQFVSDSLDWLRFEQANPEF